MGKKKAASAIYQLKISLKGARPPIWRRVQVSSDITLGTLHQIIQAAMGWYDCHLHEFEVQGQSYGQPMPDYDWDVRDENKTKLSQLVSHEKFKFVYIYDMGDSWEHQILAEKILQPDPETRSPVCIKGKRACPPEDCGGIWGYAEFLEAIGDPQHSEHQQLLEWVGGEFDPESFELEAVNWQLQHLR